MKTLITLLLTALSLNAASVIVGWDQNPVADNITGYKVYWGTNSRTYFWTNSVSGTNTQATLTNLSNGQRYSIAVTAVNPLGESDYSAELTYTVPAVPRAPTNLRILGVLQASYSGERGPWINLMQAEIAQFQTERLEWMRDPNDE